MNIMSFNTQHCQSFTEQCIDFELMARTITDCGADIVGLNEMRGEGSHPDYTDQVPQLAVLTGLSHHYFAEAFRVGGENPYGNGLLSRYPIEYVETIPIPMPSPRGYDGYYEPRCVLKARLQGGITVLVAHFGLNPDEQESAVDTVLTHLTDTRCILMGDFNTQPDDAVLAPIRARMADAADCFAGPRLSYPSDAPQCKIDYIFVSRDIRVVAADIPTIVASDHRPHTAEIEVL